MSVSLMSVGHLSISKMLVGQMSFDQKTWKHSNHALKNPHHYKNKDKWLMIG
jgi:hypothetical protein